jgi:hypothetical protein
VDILDKMERDTDTLDESKDIHKVALASDFLFWAFRPLPELFVF